MKTSAFPDMEPLLYFSLAKFFLVNVAIEPVTRSSNDCANHEETIMNDESNNDAWGDRGYVGLWAPAALFRPHLKAPGNRQQDP
ncbi:hypothetical protein SFRURICE_007767 [Spodoptera frugiperda]|uniref:SFRICE_012254 n=1 Tax=Spodoptera frugiperda TaxID=7108 RepID=A0A2H1VXJ9_SPOFR|nr:hypothetical protein SFRURICE_007767 [Spodoptera frugiperda]